MNLPMAKQLQGPDQPLSPSGTKQSTSVPSAHTFLRHLWAAEGQEEKEASPGDP